MGAETRYQTDKKPQTNAVGHARRLDSWKEIAVFFNRDIRTVQLWEKRERLPVHRHEHGARSSIYAWPDELQQWLNQRKPQPTPASATPEIAKRKRSTTQRILLILAAAAPLAAAAFFWRSRHPMETAIPTAPAQTLAVLPFENFTSDPNQDYLSDGITDELTSDVAAISGLQVVARTSAFQFRHKAGDVREIGRKLNAAALLEGSLGRNGDRLRINVQLIRAADGYHIWSHIYDCGFGDVSTIEDQIARGVENHLNLGSSSNAASIAESQHAANQHVPDEQAHEMYLRGRYWSARTVGADQLKAVSEFSQAVARDPFYAQAWLGLSDAYVVMATNEEVSPADVISKARAAAERALALDPNLGGAHAALAHLSMFHDWDAHGAEQQFRIALQLNPNDATAHHWYGLLYLYTGRFDEAKREVRRAQELDPLAPILPAVLSRVYLFAGDTDQAIRIALDAILRDPTYAVIHDALGQAYRQKGQYGPALEQFNQYLRLSHSDPDAWTNLAQTYAQMGDRAKAIEILNRLQKPDGGYVSPYNFALVYAALGDKTRMYDWLDQAMKVHAAACVMLNVEPAFQPWRSEPRFQELVARTRVPGMSTSRN
jgi:TolB-like protein/Flp pilus assembly protein TadD